MPQFRYAYNRQNELVDVLELPQDLSGFDDEFTCIGCGTPLIAKTKGEKREKHFAHKANQRATCSEETYLHKLAKTTFVQVYSDCLENNEPFCIKLTHQKICTKFSGSLGHPCHIGTVTKEHDLTRYYDGVRLEPRDNAFVPDVIIYDTRDEAKKVYIEIAVTHFLSDEKRGSENRIIEIPIESENDIDKIRSKRLTESDASFINFENRNAPVTDGECKCAKDLYFCLFIYESGKSFLEYGTLGELEAKRKRVAGSIRYESLVRARGQEAVFLEQGPYFVELIEEAHRRGFPVKNCFLCRYAGRNWSPHGVDPVFCKITKRTCGSNEAVQCARFRAHPEEDTR